MSVETQRPPASPPAATGRLLQGPGGSEHWEVEHIDALRPFLVSLLSASDVWAYVSTAGGLAAGRVVATLWHNSPVENVCCVQCARSNLHFPNCFAIAMRKTILKRPLAGAAARRFFAIFIKN